MTPGILRKTWGNDSATATMTPDGWQSADERFARQLQQMCPIVGTEAGVSWIIAFWQAVKGLGAEVVQEPADAAP